MKAYILKHASQISEQYANTCAASCDRVGLPWEYFEGFSNMRDFTAWNNIGLFDFVWNNTKEKAIDASNNRAGLCSAGHAAIWKKIVEGDDQVAVILEHDAIMLHLPTIAIPNDTLVALGYRLENLSKYKHERAGPPINVVDRGKHNGSHAYAITKVTAKKLLEEIVENKGPLGCIDSYYFRGKSKFKVMMTDPICALAWVRKSSIWTKPAGENANPLLKSFIEHTQ